MTMFLPRSTLPLFGVLSTRCPLLGDWSVDIRFGRIGGAGRLLRKIVATETDARRLVATCLRRRASAPKRIGLPYRVRELRDPEGWVATLPWGRPNTRVTSRQIRMPGQF
jgi:hypothetical protein